MSDLIEQLRKERSADVQDAADRLEEQELLIKAQQAEIARLRDIVVSAYHEGFFDALDEAPCCNVPHPDVLWPKTMSFAALEKKP